MAKRTTLWLGLVGIVLVSGSAAGDPLSIGAPVTSYTGTGQTAGQMASSLTPRTPSDLDELEALLRRYGDEEARLDQELAAAGPELELLEQRVVARGRHYYRLVRAGLLPVGGGFDALVDFAAEVEQTKMALVRDLDRQKSLRKRSAEIAAELERLRADRAPLMVQRDAMKRAHTALRQTDERRAAFARAFESSTGPQEYVAIYGADLGPEVDDARGGFAALHGRMPLPIAGRAEIRRVQRRGAGGPGVELWAPEGAVARSVSPGKVAFADEYDDYGITVILDHGEHYYTVYANLAAADVRVGDSLPTGERIGKVAPSGTQAVLYFEIRRGTEWLDPSAWLGMN